MSPCGGYVLLGVRRRLVLERLVLLQVTVTVDGSRGGVRVLWEEEEQEEQEEQEEEQGGTTGSWASVGGYSALAISSPFSSPPFSSPPFSSPPFSSNATTPLQKAEDAAPTTTTRTFRLATSSWGGGESGRMVEMRRVDVETRRDGDGVVVVDTRVGAVLSVPCCTCPPRGPTVVDNGAATHHFHDHDHDHDHARDHDHDHDHDRCARKIASGDVARSMVFMPSSHGDDDEAATARLVVGFGSGAVLVTPAGRIDGGVRRTTPPTAPPTTTPPTTTSTTTGDISCEEGPAVIIFGGGGVTSPRLQLISSPPPWGGKLPKLPKSPPKGAWWGDRAVGSVGRSGVGVLVSWGGRSGSGGVIYENDGERGRAQGTSGGTAPLVAQGRDCEGVVFVPFVEEDDDQDDDEDEDDDEDDDDDDEGEQAFDHSAVCCMFSTPLSLSPAKGPGEGEQQQGDQEHGLRVCYLKAATVLAAAQQQPQQQPQISLVLATLHPRKTTGGRGGTMLRSVVSVAGSSSHSSSSHSRKMSTTRTTPTFGHLDFATSLPGGLTCMYGVVGGERGGAKGLNQKEKQKQRLLVVVNSRGSNVWTSPTLDGRVVAMVGMDDDRGSGGLGGGAVGGCLLIATTPAADDSGSGSGSGRIATSVSVLGLSGRGDITTTLERDVDDTNLPPPLLVGKATCKILDRAVLCMASAPGPGGWVAVGTDCSVIVLSCCCCSKEEAKGREGWETFGVRGEGRTSTGSAVTSIDVVGGNNNNNNNNSSSCVFVAVAELLRSVSVFKVVLGGCGGGTAPDDDHDVVVRLLCVDNERSRMVSDVKIIYPYPCRRKEGRGDDEDNGDEEVRYPVVIAASQSDGGVVAFRIGDGGKASGKRGRKKKEKENKTVISSSYFNDDRTTNPLPAVFTSKLPLNGDYTLEVAGFVDYQAANEENENKEEEEEEGEIPSLLAKVDGGVISVGTRGGGEVH